MSVDKWFPLCLLASFFTENPSFPALHVVLGLSLERFVELVGTDLWVHSLRGRWAAVFSKWGITNPAEVWDNRKVYGTEAGWGTKQVRWVNFFQGASSAVEPINIYTGISSWPYRRLFGTLVRRAGGVPAYRSTDAITPLRWIILRFFMRFLLRPIRKIIAAAAKRSRSMLSNGSCQEVSLGSSSASPQRLFNPEALQRLLQAENPSLKMTPQDQKDLHDLLRALEVRNIVALCNKEWAYLHEGNKGRRRAGDNGGCLGRTQRIKDAKLLQYILDRLRVDEATVASVFRKSPDLYATAAKHAKLPTVVNKLSLQATLTLKAVLGLSWNALKTMTKLFIAQHMANPLASQKAIKDFVDKDDVKSGGVHTLELLSGPKGSTQTCAAVLFACDAFESIARDLDWSASQGTYLSTHRFACQKEDGPQEELVKITQDKGMDNIKWYLALLCVKQPCLWSHNSLVLSYEKEKPFQNLSPNDSSANWEVTLRFVANWWALFDAVVLVLDGSLHVVLPSHIVPEGGCARMPIIEGTPHDFQCFEDERNAKWVTSGIETAASRDAAQAALEAGSAVIIIRGGSIVYGVRAQNGARYFPFRDFRSHTLPFHLTSRIVRPVITGDVLMMAAGGHAQIAYSTGRGQRVAEGRAREGDRGVREDLQAPPPGALVVRPVDAEGIDARSRGNRND